MRENSDFGQRTLMQHCKVESRCQDGRRALRIRLRMILTSCSCDRGQRKDSAWSPLSHFSTGAIELNVLIAGRQLFKTGCSCKSGDT